MHVAVVFLEARREHIDALRRALTAHADLSLTREPGCLRFDVCHDPLEPASFLLFEMFSTEADYAAHRELDHTREFRARAEPWIETRRILTYTLIAHAGSA